MSNIEVVLRYNYIFIGLYTVRTIIGSSFSVTIETICRIDNARKNNGGKIPLDPIIEDILSVIVPG